MSGAPLRLGVKLCGNCNPDIRSMWVVKQIAEELGAELSPCDQAPVRLVVSACGAACVEDTCPCSIKIRGLCLNGLLCKDEMELIERAVELLRPFYYGVSPERIEEKSEVQ